MALAPDDVLLLQRADGAKAHFKLTLSDLGGYIDAQDIVRFKGTRDFTDTLVDPLYDGTGRTNGDMYINTGVGVLVANNWADMNGNVSTGDRAVWNEAETKWEVITSNSSTGGTITAVRGTLPIEVNSDNPAQPIVEIRRASRGDNPDTNSGAVARLALDAEVAITGTSGDDAVVTANQLRATNQSMVTSVQGTLPIQVDSDDSANPTVEIRTASRGSDPTTNSGAVARLALDTEVAIGGSAGDDAVVTANQLRATNESMVTAVQGTLPIQVDSTDSAKPIVAIRTASRGSNPSTNSGAVARLALDAEVAITGTTGDDAVVTANQLRATNASIVARVPDGTAAGQYLRWSGTAWAGSDVIDGGEYAT